MNKDMEEFFLDGVKELFENNNKALDKKLSLIYSQLESLMWLQRGLAIKGPLPPLRGWPVSPDFLLLLQSWILEKKPSIVVELGCGATTIVIADALRQNGTGLLYSFEHVPMYANEIKRKLKREFLTPWVDFRVGGLVEWNQSEESFFKGEGGGCWYSGNLADIESIDLLIVDGPPKAVCSHSRFPALPVFIDRFSDSFEVWMDDANRKDEKEICEQWAKMYGLKVESYPLEKGLSVLRNV